MPFALTTLVDIPGEFSPFGVPHTRFFGADAEPGTNLVRLGIDKAILWTPTITLADARATVLADSPDDMLSAGRRSVLNTLAGDRTFQPTDRLKNIVFNLLRQAPAGKWNPLQPNTWAGRYELWLGPGGVDGNLIASEDAPPDGPHSQDIQDHFNGGTSNLDGLLSSDGQFTWKLIVGTAANDQVIAQQVLQVNVGNGLYLAGKLMDTADHYGQVALIGFGGGSGAGHRQDVAIWMRANDPLYTHAYAFTISNGNAQRRHFDDVANSIELAFDTTSTASGTVYVQMSGSTYTCKVNGTTILTGTDTTHDGSGTQKSVLVNGYRNNASDTVTWDDFRAADFTTPTQTKSHRRYRRRISEWSN